MWAAPDGRRCEFLFKLLFECAQKSSDTLGPWRRRGMLNNLLGFDSQGLMATAGVCRQRTKPIH